MLCMYVKMEHIYMTCLYNVNVKHIKQTNLLKSSAKPPNSTI